MILLNEAQGGESEDKVSLVLHAYLSREIEVGRYHFVRCSWRSGVDETCYR
jgi:hypothetical protein